MDYQTVLSNVFYATFPIIGFLIIHIFKKLADTMQCLEKSVDELNIKIAVIIEKTSNHEKRIEKLEYNINKP